MAGAFTQVNLANLPAPDAVEVIDFAVIRDELIADFIVRAPEFTALVESDPIYKFAETAAYREVLVRERANETVRAVMLAFARESDLDQLGANVNVERLLIQEADPNTVPPTPAVYEKDDDFRNRIQLSFEGYTTAGSEGSYVFHAVSADADVKDASAVSPTPGVVNVYVLSRTGDGTAPGPLVATVNAALNAKFIRPLTDNVTVLSATIVPFEVVAELTLYPGPDANVVRQAALDKLDEYVSGVARIGFDVTISGIMGALHQPGVMNVDLAEPTANIVIGDDEAPHCTDITVTVATETDV